MPEHLRALVVIAAIALLVFKLAERPICAAAGILPALYRQRRNLWFAVTLVAFLCGNFWIYVGVVGIMLVVYARSDGNPFAAFSLLLFAVPPFVVPIPSLGPFNYIYTLDHLRLLTLSMLLPLAFKLFAQRHRRQPATRSADWMVGGYFVLMFALNASVNNWTGIIRTTLAMLSDVALPYYVASRVVSDRKALREVLAFFVLACALLAAIAMFESVRGWLLYSALPSAMGQYWGFGNYMMRDGAGLRAAGSAGHSIILGYIMVIGLSAAIYLEPLIRPRWVWLLSIGAILGALVVTFSRGPWVGAMAALTVGLGLGRGAQRRLMRLAGAGVVLLTALSFTSMGPKLLSYLPFVGDVASDTVEYRQQLFTVSMMVWRQNFFLGTYNYMQNPLMEQMRQGEGIIDMVNSYLVVALASGFVGLVLYVGMFAASGFGVWRTYRRLAPDDVEGELLGRTCLAALAGVMVTIATASPVGAVPYLYFYVIGLSVCYARAYGARPVRASLMPVARTGVLPQQRRVPAPRTVA